MPLTDETEQRNDAITRAFEEAFVRRFETFVTKSLKERGFTDTLKSLNKARLPGAEMCSITGGVAEKKSSGLYDAALETDDGPLFLEDAKPRGQKSEDPQLISSSISESFDANIDLDDVSADSLLKQLTNVVTPPSPDLICLVEVTRFEQSQHEVLLPLLWQYILAHRDSNDREQLGATGAAIRKYIAIMPMDQMGELTVLLEAGHRSPLPIDLEIEIAKMILRNFEVHPPAAIDTQPELAQQLREMVQAYVNPRILLRSKHSAAASVAIEAIVAMRSSLAAEALQAAVSCPYGWFAELVSDNLDELREKWKRNNPEAADWLGNLQSHIAVNV